MKLMDEPIFYTRHKVSTDKHDPDKLSLGHKLYNVLVNDEKDEFIRLTEQAGSERLRCYFKSLFRNDALEIFTAILNGETPLIDEKDFWKDGMTPLHLAVLHRAPRLTKYFLDLSLEADALSKWNLKDVTPLLDLSMGVICIGGTSRNLNLHDLLWWICFHNREIMEIIRMLVRTSPQGETWAREAFIGYAREGELHKAAALFLAVSELFLSPPQKELCLLRKLKIDTLNSWDDDAPFIKEHLPLLCDVFTFVGLELAAYIRLEGYGSDYFSERDLPLEIDYFLLQVAYKKMPKSGSRDYYYLRFFYTADCSRPCWIGDDDDWDTWPSLIPRLKTQDADILASAIEKKLSSLDRSKPKKKATVNPFDAAHEQKAAAAAVATTQSAKLLSRPLPLAQAVCEH